VAIQTHLDNTKDFTAHLLAFRQAGVDGVISWTDDVPAASLVKQMKTLGVTFGIAGSTTYSDAIFLSLAGDAAEGAYAISDFVPSNPDPVVVAWNAAYRAAYGEGPDITATWYYDAMKLLALAASQASSITGTGIRDALMKTKDLRGAMTTYTWTPGGNMAHSALITRVKGNVAQVLAVISE
jgi:branched-chain amino acid transport system substrate-binding protein